MFENFLKTFHKPFALKFSQNFFIKTGVWGSTACFENKKGAWAQPFALQLSGSLGDREPMVDFSKLYIMLINHQPLEAYFCLLYPSEHGSLCSTVPVEGPVSASPVSGA